MKLLSFISKRYLEIICLILFLILVPITKSINFIQNDEWVYYQNLENFLKYDFRLLDKTAPSFYSVGFLATAWSIFFGRDTVPILTMLISILCFYLLVKIIELKFNFSKFTNILISLILFTNFLFNYSSIGFMTENYLVFFLLLSVLFFEKYEKFDSKKFLHISNIFSILAFFVKQSGIVFLVATFFYYVLRKQYRNSLIQLSYICTTLLFYFFFFPKTSEMTLKTFSTVNFVDKYYITSLVLGILIYLAFFTLPLIFTTLQQFFSDNYKNVKIVLLFLILSLATFFILNKFFKPAYLEFGEFPYFKNIFERTGYFPKNITGKKYQFMFNYDYYLFADFISKLSSIAFVAFLLISLKKIINVYSISIFGFIVLMFFAPPFYDRYLVYALPLLIIFICEFIKESHLFKALLGFFILYQGFLSYVFFYDYILTHIYIWNRSVELSKTINPNLIKATHSWGSLSGKSSTPIIYLFSFDSFQKNPNLTNEFKLVESKIIDFPGNIFIEPYIYLYKRID